VSWATASDGVQLHYETLGRREDPPVLFIQGLGADKNLWNLQRFWFARNYRVIAHDNRGAGRSDRPFGSYTLEQMADDAIAVLDHAGIESAHVVGASMGGAITQALGVLHADRVRSLTLVCTSCTNHPWRVDLLTEWAEVAEREGMGAMAKHAARWMIGPRSLRRIAPAMSIIGTIARSNDSHGFLGQVRAILDADPSLAPRLAEITAPTCVIVGGQDVLTPRGDSEEIAERIPTAELNVLSGAAHGLMIEHATTFNRVLGDFLGRAENRWSRTSAGTSPRHLRVVRDAS
jgi:3-oxoadipate enol-lactonase